QLAGAGATLFPDLLLENKLRQAADLPEITAEEYEERREQARQEEMEANMPMGPGFGGGARPSRPAGPESGATGSPRSNGGGRRTFSFDRPVRSVDGRGRGES
ncbi:MAG: hypothetical protein R3324_09490, partial [Halobacteriales archaeon]|nr:hypothetical protein [Halobacteriales archaeon]